MSFVPIIDKKGINHIVNTDMICEIVWNKKYYTFHLAYYGMESAGMSVITRGAIQCDADNAKRIFDAIGIPLP